MMEREFEPIVLRDGPGDDIHLTTQCDWVEVVDGQTAHRYRRTDEMEQDERGYEYRVFRFTAEG